MQLPGGLLCEQLYMEVAVAVHFPAQVFTRVQVQGIIRRVAALPSAEMSVPVHRFGCRG